MDASNVGMIAHGAGDTSGVFVAAWRRLGIDARFLTPKKRLVRAASSVVGVVRVESKLTVAPLS